MAAIFATSTTATHMDSQITLDESSESLDWLIVGDWGHKPAPKKNAIGPRKQIQIADAMIKLSETVKPRFTISVGDNFYNDGFSVKMGGVSSVKDKLWDTLWSDVYLKGELADKQWWSVLGNHDWRGNTKAQIDYGKLDRMPNQLWKMPDYFWHTEIPLPQSFCRDDPDCKPLAAYIFIDTNFLFHGYKYKDPVLKKYQSPLMIHNFRNAGWNSDSAAEIQIKYLNDTLEEYKDAAYIFVTGHHPLGKSGPIRHMKQINALLLQYKVTAYFHGHVHSLELARESDTLFVLSGASSKNKQSRKPSVGGKAKELYDQYGQLGYVQAKLTKSGFSVKFRGPDNQVLYNSGNDSNELASDDSKIDSNIEPSNIIGPRIKCREV